jgi:hypothetical protein
MSKKSAISDTDRQVVCDLIDRGMFPKQIKEHLPHVSIHTISGINRIRKLGPVNAPKEGVPGTTASSPSQTILQQQAVAAAKATLPQETASAPIARSIEQAAPVQPAIPPRPSVVPGPFGVPVEVPSSAPPASPLSAITPERMARALETGFQPMVVNASQAPGHLSTWQVKFMIRRVEPPDGVLGEEYPPFGAPQLLQKYGGGLYEIDFLRNGVLVDRQIERIAGPPRKVEPQWRTVEESLQELGAGPSSSLQRRALAPSGEETMIKAMDTIAKIEDRIVAKNASAVDTKQSADASVAQTAIAALQRVTEKPPDTTNTVLFEKMLLMEQGRADSDRRRYEEERKLMELRHQQELVREQERAKHEIEVKRMEMDATAKQSETFFVKMQELANMRDAKMQEIASQREALQREFAEKQQGLLEKHLEEERAKLAEMNEAILKNDEEKKAEFKEWKRRETEHFEEVKKLRTAGSAEVAAIETQKMWGDIVKNGLETLGTKVEKVMQARVLGEIAPAGGIQLPAGASVPGLGGPAKPKAPTGGNGNMATMAETIFGTQIFKETIGPDLDMHIQNRTPSGMFLSWLGGLAMEDGRVNIFVNWLFLRTWPQVLAEAQRFITPQSFAIWNDAGARAWFDKVRKIYYDQLRQQEEAMEAASGASAPAPQPAPSGPVLVQAEPAAPPAPVEAPQTFRDQ